MRDEDERLFFEESYINLIANNPYWEFLLLFFYNNAVNIPLVIISITTWVLILIIWRPQY